MSKFQHLYYFLYSLIELFLQGFVFLNHQKHFQYYYYLLKKLLVFTLQLFSKKYSGIHCSQIIHQFVKYDIIINVILINNKQ
ncbi:unnamed protein product [Paramecium sonneborni]|uniref:Transmembrane protein n=1 Tax=Paramecium sonneborni TaxID=65129 RepID=A0A8S1LMB0_9CILI|nr:unnamed protein product [Paramecium sonneborni]